jgi:hypothetical protein
MPLTVLGQQEQRAFVVFKSIPGVEDINDKESLAPDVYDTLRVVLNAAQTEFLAEVSSSGVFSNSTGTRQLRGANDERRLPTVCPPDAMTCPTCIRRLEDNICYLCDNCQRRALFEQLFPTSSRDLQSDTSPNPMAGLKCKKAKSSILQDEITGEAKKERVKKFAAGFNRSSVGLYICKEKNE